MSNGNLGRLFESLWPRPKCASQVWRKQTGKFISNITHYEGIVQNLEKNMVSLRGSSFVIHDECCVASAWKKHVVVKKKKNRRRIRSVKTPCSIYQCTWIITTLFRGPFFQCLTHQGCVAKAVAAVFHGVGKPFELQEVQKSVNGWMVGG